MCRQMQGGSVPRPQLRAMQKPLVLRSVEDATRAKATAHKRRRSDTELRGQGRRPNATSIDVR